MNRKNVLAIVAGILTIIITWLLVIFISSFIIDKLNNVIIAGNYVQDSWSFYNNAHLLEEMYEGKYNPLSDPIFLVSIIVIYTPAFFIGALLSRYIANNNIPSYIAVATCALSVIAITHRDIFNLPSKLIQPICCELAVIIVALVAGVVIGKRMQNRMYINV